MNERLGLVKKNGQQSFDIWFHEPYSFGVEFDESQHFNQFRYRTLNFYSELKYAFDVEFYSKHCNLPIKAGKSGFQKLRRPDPIFPEMLIGDAQDNRIRQRAFRDFLKDIIPVSKGLNPTLRIPHHIVNRKTKGFNDSDLSLIRGYVEEFINNLKVRNI